MNDKKILEEVYRRLGGTGSFGEKVKSFIEQEWQKADEEERDMDSQYNDPDHPLNKHDEGQQYKMHSADVAEIERHRGLEIDSNGTVTELK